MEPGTQRGPEAVYRVNESPALQPGGTGFPRPPEGRDRRAAVPGTEWTGGPGSQGAWFSYVRPVGSPQVLSSKGSDSPGLPWGPGREGTSPRGLLLVTLQETGAAVTQQTASEAGRGQEMER